MTDLSDYEMRVLRQMATGQDQGIVSGAALDSALETLRKRGFATDGETVGGFPYWDVTEAGWRVLEEEANNG